MAQSVRDLRRRIRSLRNTQQITQAMKMVSAAKLRRSQEAAEASRPYGAAVADMLAEVAARAGHVDHPLLRTREVRRRALVVMTGDRGLAGPYNAQVLRRALAEAGPDRTAVGIVAVGRKGRDFFARRGYEILASFVPVGDEARFAQAQAIAQVLGDLFSREAVDEVRLCYSEFVSVMVQRPTVRTLLPVVSPERERGGMALYEFEPSAEEVLAALLPHYLEVQVLRALQEAKASEHGARMTAMDAASRNAEELIRQSTLVMNRLRQAQITKEIAEIVGGAEALQ